MALPDLIGVGADVDGEQGEQSDAAPLPSPLSPERILTAPIGTLDRDEVKKSLLLMRELSSPLTSGASGTTASSTRRRRGKPPSPAAAAPSLSPRDRAILTERLLDRLAAEREAATLLRRSASDGLVAENGDDWIFREVNSRTYEMVRKRRSPRFAGTGLIPLPSSIIIVCIRKWCE